MMLADGRFARNTDYIFYAQYLSDVYQVLSGVSIAARKSFSNAMGNKITVGNLIDKECLAKILKRDDGFKFLKGIRGTPSFWSTAQKNLFAMIRQIGLPTWFCSFSAGDMRWKELIGFLLRYENDFRAADDLDWSEKCGLLKRNPVLAARMFDHRFHTFLKQVILSPVNPIGKVKDYFYRVEFQQRGSPHTHCLFWIEDAPKLDVNSDDDLVSFVDRYITCKMPDSDDEELQNIVTSVQRHSKKHSKSCTKKGTKCRFNFPRPPSTRTFVARASEENVEKETTIGNDCMKKREAKSVLEKVWKELEDNESPCSSTEELFAKVGISQELFEKACGELNKKQTIVLERMPTDVWVNQYNSDLLRCWDANMDIQFVLDAYSCIVYIISYISKAEREMGLLLDHARKESLDGNHNAKLAMKKIGSVYLHNREVSAQEAAYRVCNLNLKECSRMIQFIPTGDDTVRMSLPLNVLQNKISGGEINSEEIWMSSSVDRYLNRPTGNEFDTMCLATFCSEFRILSKSEISSSLNRKHRNPVHKLQNDLGCVQKRSRTSPAIVRYARFQRDKEPEKYHYSILQLFLPHRNKCQLKPGTFETYQDFYESGCVGLQGSGVEPVSSIVDRNMASFEMEKDSIDRAVAVLENSGPMEDAWAQICPESELDRLTCGDELRQKNPDPKDDKDMPDLIQVENRKYTLDISKSVIPYSEGQAILRSLNNEQRDVFYKIRDWCLDKKNGGKPESFYLFVTGGAGTGKSHLIKSIQYEASRLLASAKLNPDDITVLLTAPTGVAAFNINASTIHSTFSIAVDVQLPYQPLGDEKINSLRAQLLGLEILIIDEISMVDHRLLTYIHGRLRQIKQCKDFSPFGNVSVMAVGDFYQLPPVKGKSLMSHTEAVDLWSDNFRAVELTQIMRQKDAKFAETLNSLRKKTKDNEMRKEDFDMLTQRETGEQSDALHIFATNKQVDAYNVERLIASCSNHVTIEAEDYFKDTKTKRMCKKTKQHVKVYNTNLCQKLTIAVGARVMLIKNMDVADGMVNGVFGTVSHIEHVSDKPFPRCIYVVFDNESVGEKLRDRSQLPANIDLKSTPVTPCEDRINNSGGLRRQFPLKLSFASTIHKLQGTTLTEAVVSLGKFFSAGQAYVALSRVSSLDGLIIQDFSEEVIYCNENVRHAMSTMPKFLSKPLPPLEINCDLLLHNIQGLRAHVEDIRLDKYRLCPNFICLTETWFSKADSLAGVQVDGYQLTHKAREDCYDDYLPMYSNLKHQEHGGVCVYSRTHTRPEFIDVSATNLECIIFKDVEHNTIVAVVYRPLSYIIELFRQNLAILLDNLISFPGKCVVMGDLNENVIKSRTIPDLFSKYGYKQCVTEPTTENGTLIDHVYIRSSGQVEVQVVPTYFSYHEAIAINY